MKRQGFRKGVFSALQQRGFVASGALLRATGHGAVVVVGTERGFGSMCFVNVGLCLERLGAAQPDRLELSHMYYRLESLFPEHRELILTAGSLAEPGQPEAYQQFLKLLAGDIADGLHRLASERGVIDAYREGRLNRGFMHKEARAVLDPST